MKIRNSGYCSDKHILGRKFGLHSISRHGQMGQRYSDGFPTCYRWFINMFIYLYIGLFLNIEPTMLEAVSRFESTHLSDIQLNSSGEGLWDDKLRQAGRCAFRPSQKKPKLLIWYLTMNNSSVIVIDPKIHLFQCLSNFLLNKIYVSKKWRKVENFVYFNFW